MLQRHPETERTAAAFLAFKDYCTTLVFYDALGHEEAKAGSIGPDVLGVAGSIKLLEQLFLRVFGYAYAGIGYGQLGAASCLFKCDGYAS